MHKQCEKSNSLPQLVGVFKEKGEKTESLIPGDIFINNFQITLKLVKGSASAWKKGIKQTYQSVIIGAQKITSMLNMKV